MFVHSIDSVLFSIGRLEVRYYGLAYLLGFLLLYIAYRQAMKRGYLSGLMANDADDLLLYVMIGVIVGARLFYAVFYDLASMIAEPLNIFAVWMGGMSFHGGLAGAIIGMCFWARRRSANIIPVLNITAVVAAIALAIGRIANFLNSELVGTPSDAAWCVVFTAIDDVCRHPYQLYASISHFLLFGYLIFLLYINRDGIVDYLKSKWLIIHFLIGYGILRIIVDLWKAEPYLYGLKMGQWLSVAMIAAGALLLVIDRRMRRKN